MSETAKIRSVLRRHQFDDPELSPLLKSLERFEIDQDVARFFPATVSRLLELLRQYCPSSENIPEDQWNGSIPQALLLMVLQIARSTTPVANNPLYHALPKLYHYRWVLAGFAILSKDASANSFVVAYQQKMYFDLLNHTFEAVESSIVGPRDEIDYPAVMYPIVRQHLIDTLKGQDRLELAENLVPASSIQLYSFKLLAELELFLEKAPFTQRIKIRRKMLELFSHLDAFRCTDGVARTGLIDFLTDLPRDLGLGANSAIGKQAQLLLHPPRDTAPSEDHQAFIHVRILEYNRIRKELESASRSPNHKTLCKLLQKEGRWFVRAFKLFLYSKSSERDFAFCKRIFEALDGIEKAAGAQRSEIFMAHLNACRLAVFEHGIRDRSKPVNEVSYKAWRENYAAKFTPQSLLSALDILGRHTVFGEISYYSEDFDFFPEQSSESDDHTKDSQLVSRLDAALEILTLNTKLHLSPMQFARLMQHMNSVCEPVYTTEQICTLAKAKYWKELDPQFLAALTDSKANPFGKPISQLIRRYSQLDVVDSDYAQETTARMTINPDRLVTLASSNQERFNAPIREGLERLIACVNAGVFPQKCATRLFELLPDHEVELKKELLKHLVAHLSPLVRAGYEYLVKSRVKPDSFSDYPLPSNIDPILDNLQALGLLPKNPAVRQHAKASLLNAMCTLFFDTLKPTFTAWGWFKIVFLSILSLSAAWFFYYKPRYKLFKTLEQELSFIDPKELEAPSAFLPELAPLILLLENHLAQKPELDSIIKALKDLRVNADLAELSDEVVLQLIKLTRAEHTAMLSSTNSEFLSPNELRESLPYALFKTVVALSPYVPVLSTEFSGSKLHYQQLRAVETLRGMRGQSLNQAVQSELANMERFLYRSIICPQTIWEKPSIEHLQAFQTNSERSIQEAAQCLGLESAVPSPSNPFLELITKTQWLLQQLNTTGPKMWCRMLLIDLLRASYAIERGTYPTETLTRECQNFEAQFQAIALTVESDRTRASTEPLDPKNFKPGTSAALTPEQRAALTASVDTAPRGAPTAAT